MTACAPRLRCGAILKVRRFYWEFHERVGRVEDFRNDRITNSISRKLHLLPAISTDNLLLQDNDAWPRIRHPILDWLINETHHQSATSTAFSLSCANGSMTPAFLSIVPRCI